MEAQKSQFTLDGGPAYDGYTKGDRWNGWACPYFTRGVIEEIASTWSDSEEDSIKFVDGKCVITVCGETETIDMTSLETEEGIKDVYDFGLLGFVWEDESDHIEFEVEDRVIRVSSDYTNGRKGPIVEIDHEKGRARVAWEGHPKTWVKFSVLRKEV